MRFALSEDQGLLQDSLNRGAGDLSPLTAVRKVRRRRRDAGAGHLGGPGGPRACRGCSCRRSTAGWAGHAEAALAAEALGRVVARDRRSWDRRCWRPWRSSWPGPRSSGARWLPKAGGGPKRTAGRPPSPSRSPGPATGRGRHRGRRAADRQGGCSPWMRPARTCWSVADRERRACTWRSRRDHRADGLHRRHAALSASSRFKDTAASAGPRTRRGPRCATPPG
jgi:hypothetical protein